VLTILWLYIAGHVLAQSSATQLKFEIASVKPSAPDAPGMFIRYLPGGGLRITGATLQNLISMAYDVRAFQISGGPKWIDNDRFDINARLTTSDAPHPTLTRQDQSKAAEGLRNLLADRFQLTLHPETTEQPVFALVVAKAGSKLQELTESESFIRRMGRGSIKGQAVALRLLVLNLAGELGRTVIDKTGLTGKYSFELKWDPSIAPDPSEPSLFTALQEQLGLRLESQRGEVTVLVVDRAQKPAAN
jgi:bla regulator protein BlaR1